MPRHYAVEERICLNGWWDFLPVREDGPRSCVPDAGWLREQYLVPSFWTKPVDGVRKRGEKYFTEQRDLLSSSDAAAISDVEFLFDAFGYPNEWSLTRRAWVRRTLELPEMAKDKRLFLEFDAVEPKPTLFINGRSVATHIHPTLPLNVDVTDLVRAGSNEIALFIDEYDLDENGRVKTPCGSWNIRRHCGIWQDVHLVQRGVVRVSDVTVRTSYRRRQVEIIWELTNAADVDQTVDVISSVHEWDRASRSARSAVALAPVSFSLNVPARGMVTHRVLMPWENAVLWQPETPHLYILQTTVAGHETHRERFGFREVWIDGADLMLNGYPLHLFSDWGHKLTPYCFTENWIRQWFGMIRDANMNHSRLHTHPHPELIMDIADEEGILITGETGLHGSGADLAADSPEFWDAARDHVSRFVRRDKNHSCIIMWSVGNEMRWNPHTSRQLEDNLPQLRKMFNELDPTRPAYHEGDSSLWNESEQDIISRHYYKACAGTGWWNGEQPLHSGEMSLYHYAGPNNTAHLAGDQAWASFNAVDEGAARDTAWIIEAGRAVGVCCFGPWNLSCLENLRMESELVRIDYSDYATPGIKPLQVMPYSSEFSFWQPSAKGYTPNASFAIQKYAFRPFAVLDVNRRSGYFTDAVFKRQLVVVNDTADTVSGRIEGALLDSVTGATLAVAVGDMEVKRGQRGHFDVALELDNMDPGRYVWRVRFIAVGGDLLDAWERTVFLASRKGETLPAARVAVFGPGSLRAELSRLNISSRYVDSLDDLDADKTDLLIMEKNTVAAGSIQNRQIQRFCRAGGRVLVMEQAVSVFPRLQLAGKPLQQQHFRAPHHPVLTGLMEADLAFWGDSPYTEQGGDAFVASRVYRKDDAAQVLFILDGDEGGFGNGGLAFAGLIEVREGSGLILASQLNITGKAGTIPAAAILLGNMLRYLIMHRPIVDNSFVRVDGRTLAPGRVAELSALARTGGSVVVDQASGTILDAFSRELGVELKAVKLSEPAHQAVRVADDPLLAGVSNEDTCGIASWTYAPATSVNCIIGELFLQPLPGLEPLLETPTESCLYELFVKGGRSEPLRAHTMSRFLYAEKPERAVVLGRVRTGAGQVLFNQFAIPEGVNADIRLARLGNRLAANLGSPAVNSILDGENVPDASGVSAGYPEKIHMLNISPTAELDRRLIESTRYHLEHIHSAPILGIENWRHDVPCPNGLVAAAACDVINPIYLYARVISPVQRKDASSNLGVPNPEAYTFLDLQGEGTAEVIINEKSRGVIVLDGGVTISDIALEQGCNHFLVRWQATSADSKLRIRWRNIDMKPETNLFFA